MSQELQAIRDTVSRHLRRKPKNFDDATPLVSGGLIDSMSLIDVILDLETATGVRIPPSEVQPDDFDSIAIIATTVARFR
jgi:acyl carrier protein